MRYPMQKSTRAKLLRMYYELCVLPGIEIRIVRTWSEMINRLLGNKNGQPRKLEASDLQLDWRPLWRMIRRELWVKDTLLDPESV
jgi:proteasome activator subunit 4